MIICNAALVARITLVGTATCYRQCFGFQTLVGVRFSAPIQMDPGVQPASRTMGTGYLFLREINWGMALTTHPFSTEVKEKVECTSPVHSGPSWPDLGRTLPLPYLTH